MNEVGRLSGASAEDLPWWMRSTVAVTRAEQLAVVPPPVDGPPARHAAVLMLFSPEPLAAGRDDAGGGVDGRVDGSVLLTQRAATMRSHAGQVAFPGGRIDPDDDGPVGAALREAQEETGLDPAGVRVLGTFPEIYLPPSHFMVTPVLGWWDDPGAVAPMDPAEVAAVARVRLAGLLEPENRFVTQLRTGGRGPGFETDGLFVWGFTAGLLSKVFRLAGLERRWDVTRMRDVPSAERRR